MPIRLNRAVERFVSPVLLLTPGVHFAVIAIQADQSPKLTGRGRTCRRCAPARLASSTFARRDCGQDALSWQLTRRRECRSNAVVHEALRGERQRGCSQLMAGLTDACGSPSDGRSRTSRRTRPIFPAAAWPPVAVNAFGIHGTRGAGAVNVYYVRVVAVSFAFSVEA
jgi:hypothetical protein